MVTHHADCSAQGATQTKLNPMMCRRRNLPRAHPGDPRSLPARASSRQASIQQTLSQSRRIEIAWPPAHAASHLVCEAGIQALPAFKPESSLCGIHTLQHTIHAIWRDPGSASSAPECAKLATSLRTSWPADKTLCDMKVLTWYFQFITHVRRALMETEKKQARCVERASSHVFSSCPRSPEKRKADAPPQHTKKCSFVWSLLCFLPKMIDYYYM